MKDRERKTLPVFRLRLSVRCALAGAANTKPQAEERGNSFPAAEGLMSLEDAFQSDILEHPDDDPRGEFIRAQCLLQQTAQDDPRRLELQDRVCDLERTWGDSWAERLRGGVTRWKFRRGFVDEVWLNPQQFQDAAHVFQREPVR